MVGLRPCPFCGGANIKVINWLEVDPEREVTGLTKDNWSVLCQDCFARGGVRRTATEAAEAWEMRQDRTECKKCAPFGYCSKKSKFIYEHGQGAPSAVKDVVNHPSHYESGRFECIDVMEETQGKEAVMDFCICNAFKYLYRHKRKNGIEDIKKARWYLDKFIELAEREEVQTDDQSTTAGV